jgi:RpiR family transcriptional regulator, carbohydrate utilization regulator
MAQLKLPSAGDANLSLNERIDSVLPALSKCESKVARIYVEDPIEFASLTVKQISRMAHVSPPTVLRFCRSMGFAGFADFKDRCESRLQ